jgi:GT2 family glycosyltransferase
VLHGKIIDFDTRDHVWWWEWYGFEEQVYQDREFPTPWKVAEGLCALRRSAVLSVGGFPEEYFIMDAGRDLAIKLIEARYAMLYTPGVVFEHKSSVDREKTDRYRLHSDRRMYFKLRNELWTLWKYYPLHHVFAKTPAKMAMWAFVMARRGSLPSYGQAMVDAFKGIPVIMKKRRPMSKATLRTVEYSRFRALGQLREVMSWYYIVKHGAGSAPRE